MAGGSARSSVVLSLMEAAALGRSRQSYRRNGFFHGAMTRSRSSIREAAAGRTAQSRPTLHLHPPSFLASRHVRIMKQSRKTSRRAWLTSLSLSLFKFPVLLFLLLLFPKATASISLCHTLTTSRYELGSRGSRTALGLVTTGASSDGGGARGTT